LDYGNSPRGTPLISKDHVYLQGAFGNITCADIASGITVWTKNLANEFSAEIPTWGFCGSPILVDGHIIVQTSSPSASLIALDATTGELAWKTEGDGSGYSSLVAGTLGGKSTIVGYQATDLAGWDSKSGKLLWTLAPKNKGDFNVPTPLIRDDNLWLISENNGLRRYTFNGGKPVESPAAQNEDLIPDSHSPVLTRGRIFVLHDGLHCVDAMNLKEIWKSEITSFNVYGTIIASEDRILVTTFSGEVILVDARADQYTPLGHWHLTSDRNEMYSHPALAGTKLYARVGKQIVCIEMKVE
jgi:outer membrane protein assembly factor BamB